MLESMLDPETRRSNGMHYTSAEDVHRVIDPLFLDDLERRLDSVLSMDDSVRMLGKLLDLQDEITSLGFLDPACGGGNFLVETYMSLRRLEDRIVGELGRSEVDVTARVSTGQFHGIEVDGPSASVARAALRVAEGSTAGGTPDVSGNGGSVGGNIVCANALTVDWNDVLPADECDYVIGNPPFVSKRTRGQTDEMRLVWGDGFDPNMDYATGWFRKSADYLDGTGGSFAFIATSSVTQGAPVKALFKPLFDNGWRISFAWRPFPWGDGERGRAGVHVVVIGMDQLGGGGASLFDRDGVTVCENVNPYLSPAPTFFIGSRRTPISSELPAIHSGTKPADHGFLQIRAVSEYERFMADPVARRFVRRCIGANELINGRRRWCIWMEGADPEVISRSPLLGERIDGCREWRLRQPERGDARKLADTPWLWRVNRSRPEGPYLCIPGHFSGSRRYVTAGFVTDGAIATDACFTADDPDGLAFAVITSSAFMTWQGTVGGRLRSDCRFEKTVVWNTFPLPALDDGTRDGICRAGRDVLAARESYPGRSLADLYARDSFETYPRLGEAHEALDSVVLAVFGLPSDATGDEVVARLVECHGELERA